MGFKLEKIVVENSANIANNGAVISSNTANISSNAADISNNGAAIVSISDATATRCTALNWAYSCSTFAFRDTLLCNLCITTLLSTYYDNTNSLYRQALKPCLTSNNCALTYLDYLNLGWSY